MRSVKRDTRNRRSALVVLRFESHYRSLPREQAALGEAARTHRRSTMASILWTRVP